MQANTIMTSDENIAHLVEVTPKRGPGRPRKDPNAREALLARWAPIQVTQGPLLPRARRTRQSKYPWTTLRAPTTQLGLQGQPVEVCDQFFVPATEATTAQVKSAAYAAGRKLGVKFEAAAVTLPPDENDPTALPVEGTLVQRIA